MQLDPALYPGHPPLLAVANKQGLLSGAQWNVVELHTWNTGDDSLQRADRMVFDLDPGEGVDWAAIVQGTELTHSFLGQLGLKSFLKTSGGKGLHVVVPIARRWPVDAVKAFSKAVVERLVQEARKARLADDMASAINKLEEARVLAPEDPSVLYETGQVYETMAAFDPRLADQASDAYLKVMSLGTTGAGALYPLAAAKIRDGISMPADLRGELALGNPRVFEDDSFENGQRVVVTVPVQAAQGTEISANDLVVKVNFFDSTMKDGKLDVQPAAEGICQTVHEWVSGEFDFVGGEELLRVTYTLPPQEIQEGHLFGKRKYYGQTVEVFYKGELIDAHARPRHLAAFRAAGGRPADDMPEFLTEDMIDNGGSVLPALDGEFLPEMPDLVNPDGSIPALPEN